MDRPSGEILPQEKRATYEKILGGIPDVLFILSGNIVWDGRKFRSTTYQDSDQHGMLGGKARVIVGAELAKYFPETKIVPTTHTNPALPSEASVMEQELIRLGVPREQILKEEQSFSTHSELVEMVKLASLHKWEHVGIVTSDYHVPRVQEMYEYLEALSSDEIFQKQLSEFRTTTKVTFVEAESILPLRSKHYVKLIEDAKKTEEYARRLDSEKGGREDLKKKQYDMSSGRTRSTVAPNTDKAA